MQHQDLNLKIEISLIKLIISFKTYTKEYSIKINLEKMLITLPKLNGVKIRGYNKLKEIPGTIKMQLFEN